MATEVQTIIVEPPPQDPTKAAIEGRDAGQVLGESKPKPQRPRRPNYAQIHSRSLPVAVYPLPAFIPHNPLSIVRIAITLLSHSIWPPSSHATVHKAYFSPETHSIHVTNPQSIRVLWEQGFWGAGSLSRSEPRWLDQEKRKRGIEAKQTSEEITQQRRNERRLFKLERARLEREAIEQQQRTEANPLEITSKNEVSDTDMLAAVPDNTVQEENVDNTSSRLHGGTVTGSGALLPGADNGNPNELTTAVLPDELYIMIEDQEHLQLTLEEAFFLTYSLGALNVYKDEELLPSWHLLRLYCTYATFPISENAERDLHNLDRFLNIDKHLPGTSDVLAIAPDNPFLLKYVVFHHFRSLGWVVRPGIKFAVDYLLYNRGPVFSHAEFAIMIVPSYSHSYWTENSERRTETKKKESRDWWWLHRVNRVQSHVHKTLMLVYVEIPPPWDCNHLDTRFKVDIGDLLKKYTVREFVIRRWTPNRHRD